MAVGDVGIWRDTSNNQTINAVVEIWDGVQFDTPQGTPSAIFTQNANDIDITINESGRYLVVYEVRSTSTSNARHTVMTRILYNSAIVEGGYGYSYVRNDNNDEGYTHGHAVIDVTSGNDVRIEWTAGEVAGSDVTSLSKSYINIVRLSGTDDVAYGSYTDGTDTGAYSTQAWDT